MKTVERWMPNGARAVVAALSVTVLVAISASSTAQAGNYVVAQCSPSVYPGTPDAGFTSTSAHYLAHADCTSGGPGLQITHSLKTGETGTVQGAYGAWVFTAPPGTFINGGSVFSNLATDVGQHGYVAVSPDAGSGVAFSNTNDGQGHTAGIPPGNWRYLVARLECTQPNENGRCVGGAGGAHTNVKQIRIQLADVVSPSVHTGGSLLSGEEVHGPQTLDVSASDEGAGLRSVQVLINGKSAGGEDLSGACNPLPGNLTSRLSPCPPSFMHTFTLDTAQPPFKEGMNGVQVCVSDYAQTGTANSACESHEVLVDNLCPGSPVAGGKAITSGFAGNGTQERTLSFRQKALIRGRVMGDGGSPISGAQVCIQGRTDLDGRPFHLIGTTTTNENGGWSYKLNRGASRRIRVGYRYGANQVLSELTLHVKARATFHLSKHRTHARRRFFFSGSIIGPLESHRVVVVKGTVPGAHRRYLIRHARTDQEGHFRVPYSFAPLPVTTRFVFWAVVPNQNGYPYARGRSVGRYIRLSPGPAPHKKKQGGHR
ncbi:MAG TPA: hypothetical protein VFM94_01150 [Solirubrobacterales bacterium]|nr:hypothetical protein [Solirubrobacterales bacterium]